MVRAVTLKARARLEPRRYFLGFDPLTVWSFDAKDLDKKVHSRAVCQLPRSLQGILLQVVFCIFQRLCWRADVLVSGPYFPAPGHRVLLLKSCKPGTCPRPTMSMGRVGSRPRPVAHRAISVGRAFTGPPVAP